MNPISILLSIIIEINASCWIRIIIIIYLFFLFICLLIVLNSTINTWPFSWVLVLFKHLLNSIFSTNKTWRPSCSIVCIWNINHCRWISYLGNRDYPWSIWINSFNSRVDCWQIYLLILITLINLFSCFNFTVLSNWYFLTLKLYL